MVFFQTQIYNPFNHKILLNPAREWNLNIIYVQWKCVFLFRIGEFFASKESQMDAVQGLSYS